MSIRRDRSDANFYMTTGQHLEDWWAEYLTIEDIACKREETSEGEHGISELRYFIVLIETENCIITSINCSKDKGKAVERTCYPTHAQSLGQLRSNSD